MQRQFRVYMWLTIALLIIVTMRSHAQQMVAGDQLMIENASEFEGTVGHPDYISQLQRWLITPEGAADFRYLFVDEMHAKSFIADLEQALAGGQIITKSVAMLAANFTNPAAGATATLTVRDLPSAANIAVFEPGDTVRLRTFSRAAGTLSIADTYGVVSGYADQPGGVQTWTFTRNSGANAGGMATSTIVLADALVLDYGVSGNGYYEVNAIDGLYGVNSPYARIATWATSPIAANQTIRTQFGNLRGITGVAGEYGLLAGTYAATNGQYFRASNSAFELHGIDLSLWDGATRTFFLNHTAPSFAMGSPAPSSFGSGTGVWMGKDAGVYKFRVGDPAGNRIVWDGSTFSFFGNGGGVTNINGGNIQTDTITATQIAANAVTTSELNAGSVTAAKISVTALSAITADLGTITAGSITGVTGTFGSSVTLNSSGISLASGTSSSHGYKFEGSAGQGMFFDTGVDVLYFKAPSGFNWEQSGKSLAYTSAGLVENSGSNLGSSGNRWGGFFGTTIDVTGNVQIDADLLVDSNAYITSLAGSGRRYLCIENNGAITADNVGC